VTFAEFQARQDNVLEPQKLEPFVYDKNKPLIRYDRDWDALKKFIQKNYKDS
jgi:hypothetical protein